MKLLTCSRCIIYPSVLAESNAVQHLILWEDISNQRIADKISSIIYMANNIDNVIKHFFIQTGQNGQTSNDLIVKQKTNLNIIIIDDDEIRLENLRHHLIVLGHRVTSVTDPENALSCINCYYYDIILIPRTIYGIRADNFIKNICKNNTLRQEIIKTIIYFYSSAKYNNAIDCLSDVTIYHTQLPAEHELMQNQLTIITKKKTYPDKTNTSWRWRVENLMNMVVDGVVVIDSYGQIEMLNQAAADIFGLTINDMSGGNLADFLILPNGWTPAEWSYEEGKLSMIREIYGRRLGSPEGRTFPLECIIRDLAMENRNGHVVMLRDISARVAIGSRNEYASRFDQVTHLPNRVTLIEDLVTAIPKTGYICFIAFSNYHALDNSLHTSAFEELLRMIARRLWQNITVGIKLYYVGRGEFALIEVVTPSPDQIEKFSFKLIDSLDAPFVLSDGLEVEVEAHIGATLFPIHGQTTSQLLRNIDKTLEIARLNTSHPYILYDEGLLRTQTMNRQTQRDLRAGLEAGQFELRYQPKLLMHSKKLHGAEVLIRWKHPSRGYVSPTEFIPIAENSQFILPLGKWIIENSFSFLARLEKIGISGLRLAINISGNQLRHQDLLGVVRNACSLFGTLPSSVELEITESVLIEGVTHARNVLEELRREGITLAIDDFGTGYSSLSILHGLPFDVLKIDQSFVHRLSSDAGARAIIRNVIDLAHNLGLGTVAEGVESESEDKFLTDHGCMIGQGYLYGEPLTLDEFEAFAKNYMDVKAHLTHTRPENW